MCARVCMRVCAHACARACARERMHVRAHVRVCMCVCMCVRVPCAASVCTPEDACWLPPPRELPPRPMHMALATVKGMRVRAAVQLPFHSRVCAQPRLHACMQACSRRRGRLPSRELHASPPKYATPTPAFRGRRRCWWSTSRCGRPTPSSTAGLGVSGAGWECVCTCCKGCKQGLQARAASKGCKPRPPTLLCRDGPQHERGRKGRGPAAGPAHQ